MSMLNRGKEAQAPMVNDGAKKLMQAAAAILETEPGKLFFAHLFYRAGYNSADVPAGAVGRVDQAAVDAAARINQARRAFYIELRALVPRTHRKTLLEVELLAEQGWGSGLSSAPTADEADTAK